MNGFGWASPSFFLGFLPLIAVALYLLFLRNRQIPTIQFSSASVFKGVPHGWKARLSFLPVTLKILGLLFAIIALARPQESSTKIKRNVEGIDIVLVMDISDSMLIEDMEPENRYGAAKKTIRDFIKGRVSDRIALVLFSGEAFTRVPLTLDYKILLDATEDIAVSHKIKMGTAIGVGLATAVARLKDSTAKSRIVILLTDGENNSGTIAPETAIEIAKGYGIRVYSIGIGRDGPTQLPVIATDAFGRQIKTYQPFFSQVNEELLQLMADQTGGKYYRATRTNALANVFKDIDRLEKSKVDINRYTKYTELFQKFLIFGIILYALGFALGRTYMKGVP